MIIDEILAAFPPEVRESTSMRGLVALTKTFAEQFEATKLQLMATQSQLQAAQSQLQAAQSQLQAAQTQLQAVQERLTKSQEKIDALEEELRRLRKTPKRPKFRPNGMQPRNRSNDSQSSFDPFIPAVNASLIQKEVSEITIQETQHPEGSRFKGYQTFSVQDVSIISKEITYKLEVWQTPSGEILRAEIPKELKGQHFGSALRAFMTNLYAQGMTQPAIHEFLHGLGIEISAGHVNNIFLNEAEEYSKISEAILTAGIQEAEYIRADDTGEKHEHKPCYCTHIGGQYFSYYKTTFSKSRENFLGILLQGKEGYHINEAMIWHLFQCGVKDNVLNLFEEYKGKCYHTKKRLNRLLNELGLKGQKLREQCFEAALVGYICATLLKPGQVFLSDRAGQFALFDHAGCWVHLERPLRKIVCTSEQAEKELKQVREAIWTLYRALKEAAVTQTGKECVHKLYDELIAMRTISPAINDVIQTFRIYRDEMLKALDHPSLPLHNNDSERDIRGVAKRRNISGSTKSDLGRKFRDALMSLKQTCFRLNYSFWEYLQLWFKGHPPNLSDLIRSRYQMAAP
jgi:type II secretory pathway pseudopilin PulG